MSREVLVAVLGVVATVGSALVTGAYQQKVHEERLLAQRNQYKEMIEGAEATTRNLTLCSARLDQSLTRQTALSDINDGLEVRVSALTTRLDAANRLGKAHSLGELVDLSRTDWLTVEQALSTAILVLERVQPEGPVLRLSGCPHPPPELKLVDGEPKLQLSEQRPSRHFRLSETCCRKGYHDPDCDSTWRELEVTLVSHDPTMQRAQLSARWRAGHSQ